MKKRTMGAISKNRLRTIDSFISDAFTLETRSLTYEFLQTDEARSNSTCSKKNQVYLWD